MTRLSGWEKRLNAVVAAHQLLPGDWGVSDCFIIPDDAVEAVTGKTMYPASARRYTTDSGAAKQLLKRKFSNVREAFAAKFDEIPVAMAQRGDIGVIERDGSFSGGVFTAIGFMTRSHGGPVEFVSIDRVTAAFKVI